MREILFRGKRTDNGEWVEGYLCRKYFQEIPHDRVVIQYETKDKGKMWQPNYMVAEVIPSSISMFTGLTDKNGKKIFEGDIIKSCEYDDVYFVKYCADDNYPAFDVVPEMNIECNGLSHLHIVEGIEVIGNIHDNPELLKGGE